MSTRKKKYKLFTINTSRRNKVIFYCTVLGLILTVIALFPQLYQAYISKNQYELNRKEFLGKEQANWSIELDNGENSSEESMSIVSKNEAFIFQNAEITIYKRGIPKILHIYSNPYDLSEIKNDILASISNYVTLINKKNALIDLAEDCYPVGIKIKYTNKNTIHNSNFIYKIHFNGTIGPQQLTLNILGFEFVKEIKDDKKEIQKQLIRMNLEECCLSKTGITELEIEKEIAANDSLYAPIVQIVIDNKTRSVVTYQTVCEECKDYNLKLHITYPKYFDDTYLYDKHYRDLLKILDNIKKYPEDIAQLIFRISEYEIEFQKFIFIKLNGSYDIKKLHELQEYNFSESYQITLDSLNDALYRKVIKQVDI